MKLTNAETMARRFNRRFAFDHRTNCYVIEGIVRIHPTRLRAMRPEEFRSLLAAN